MKKSSQTAGETVAFPHHLHELHCLVTQQQLGTLTFHAHTERNYKSVKQLLVEGKLSQMSCFSCFHKEELLQMLRLWQVVGLNTAFMFIIMNLKLPFIFFI